jgi:hypothetical protein
LLECLLPPVAPWRDSTDASIFLGTILVTLATLCRSDSRVDRVWRKLHLTYHVSVVLNISMYYNACLSPRGSTGACPYHQDISPEASLSQYDHVPPAVAPSTYASNWYLLKRIAIGSTLLPHYARVRPVRKHHLREHVSRARSSAQHTASLNPRV